MKTTAKLGMIFCLTAMGSYAASWNGKLMDASCYDSKAPVTAGHKAPSADKLEKDCAPTSATTSFAVRASGKVYKLDSSSNAKVAADMKAGSIKPDKDGDVHVGLTGSLDGNTMKVDTVKGEK